MRSHRSLPVPRVPLVGRERELEAALELVRHPDVGVVTIVGPGGVGKTLLARHVAARVRNESFGTLEPVTFIDLSAAREASEVVPSVSQIFRFRGLEGLQPLDALARQLGDRRALIVLDNFEHLLAAAPSIATLVSYCTNVTCLITSREVLRVAGEHVLPLRPLALPPPSVDGSLEQVMQSAAVRLFVERAVALRPDFRVTERNVDDTVQLCRCLDGLPLALELAAAQSAVLTPAQMLDQIRVRTGVRTEGPKGRPHWLRPIDPTIEWSVGLLSDEEKHVFFALGVFAGTWNLSAAEAVCSAGRSIPVDGVLPCLARLVEASLVAAEAHPDGMRFRLLETMQAFARVRLEADPVEASRLRDAHAAHYLSDLARHAHELRGHRQRTAAARVDERMDDVRAAWRWATERRATTLLERSADALWLYFAGRGNHQEAVTLFAPTVEALGDARTNEERLALGKALRGEGSACFRLGLLERACGMLRRSVDVFRSLGLEGETSFSLNQLAAAVHLGDDVQEERRLLEESIALAREAADPWILGFSLNDLAGVHLRLGDRSTAERCAEESLALFRRHGDQRGEAFATGTLATIRLLEGRSDVAERLHQRSLDLRRANGDAWGVASSLQGLAHVAWTSGDRERARATMLDSLEAATSVHALPLLLDGIVDLASLESERGHVAYAQALLAAPLRHPAARRDARERAEALARDLDVRVGIEEPDVRADVPDVVEAALRLTQLESLEPSVAVSVAVRRDRDALSRRELEVLRILATGRSNQEIAKELGLSIRTVERHISTIYEKIGASGRVARAAATAYAYQNGIA